MTLLKRMFTPSGYYLYDCIVPAIVLIVGILVAVYSGVLRHEVAFLCFVVGAVLHAALSVAASGLRKHGRDNGK